MTTYSELTELWAEQDKKAFSELDKKVSFNRLRGFDTSVTFRLFWRERERLQASRLKQLERLAGNR